MNVMNVHVIIGLLKKSAINACIKTCGDKNMFKEFDEIHCIQYEDEALLLPKLESISTQLKCHQNRIQLNGSHFERIAKLFNKIYDAVNQNPKECIKNARIIIELYRILRNACIECHPNQKLIVSTDSLFAHSINLFKNVFNYCNELQEKPLDVILILKCSLQFYVNLISGHDVSQESSLALIHKTVWEHFTTQTFSDLLMFEDDANVSLYASIIYYNCLKTNITSLHNCFNDIKLLLISESLLKQVACETSEWSLWSVQLMLSGTNYLSFIYEDLKMKSKFVLLDVLYEHLNQEKQQCVDASNLHFICNRFKNTVADVVKIDSIPNNDTNEQTNDFCGDSILEISKLLSVLCKITSSVNYLHLLQSDRQLLEYSVDSLKSIHLLGKNGSSHFKPIHKLKTITENDEDSLSPSFGFKRDLIRLIGNLSYDCTQMQDWTRELDGIPLLLDCCNIDAKNPYIMQWCIFALRNAFQNNDQNKQIVANLSKNGVLVDDPLLNELGFRIKDGKIIERRI